MPIYEYICPKCGSFDVIQSASEKPLKANPDCKEKKCPRKAERIISAAAFHLKGGGWYKDGYGGSKKADGKSEDKSTSGASSSNDKASDSGASGDKVSSGKSSDSKSDNSKPSSLKVSGKGDGNKGGGGCGSGCKCH